MRLSEYLLDRIFSLICMLVAALVLLALLWLIETPAVFILFAEVILLAAYSTALLYDFFRKQSFYNLLQKMTEQMDIKTLLGELLVPPHFLEGQILVDVLRCCNKYQNDRLSYAEQENREYREYLDLLLSTKCAGVVHLFLRRNHQPPEKIFLHRSIPRFFFFTGFLSGRFHSFRNSATPLGSNAFNFSRSKATAEYFP